MNDDLRYKGRRVSDMTREEMLPVVGYCFKEIERLQNRQFKVYGIWRECRERARR